MRALGLMWIRSRGCNGMVMRQTRYQQDTRRGRKYKIRDIGAVHYPQTCDDLTPFFCEQAPLHGGQILEMK